MSNRLIDLIKNDEGNSYIIAEVGQAHDGSLGLAHSYIDIAADCGVDAIKFQTHIAAYESSNRDIFRVNIFPQDGSRYEYWRRLEFTAEQWYNLAQHAKRRGLNFLSSAFSCEAVEILKNCDVSAWKIASGEIENYPMLDLMKGTNKPFLISTGMSSLNEITEIVKYLANYTKCLFHCTSEYPTSAKTVGLNNISDLKRFGVCVGFSDHSGEVAAAIAARTIGARVFENHITMSKKSFGPDVSSSLTPSQFKLLVKSIRYLDEALIHKPSKDLFANNASEMRRLFSRSIVISKDLKSGDIIREVDLSYLKPGDGISAKHYRDVIGARLNEDAAAGTFLDWNMISKET